MNTIRRKSAFRVMYRLVKTDQGKPINDQWRDYFGRAFTYVAAGEEADKLTAQFGDRYEFQVRHNSLIKKSA
jgi:hypothetical protein